MRVWEISSGRCVQTVDAHSHFVTSLAWGRSRVSDASDASAEPTAHPVNVVATGSVDLSVKVWAP